MDALKSPFSELDWLFEICRDASSRILEIYRKDFEVSFKDGKEPVTLADRVADNLIVSRIRQSFPKDAFLTEEQGFLASPGGASHRVWFLDPIDGTKEFIKKNGEFAIQIALTENGRLSLGMVFQPTTGFAYGAVRGLGCLFREGESASWQKVRIPPRPENSLIIAMSRSHPSTLAQKAGEACGFTGIFQHGGVGLKLMGIARGMAHFYLNDSNSTKAWDIAAPELLFIEAGGMVSDLRGDPFLYDPLNPYHSHGLLATCDPVLHQRILEFLKTHPK